MRHLFPVLGLVCALSMGAQEAVTADALLQRGREHFRSGRYQEAATDLAAAAQQYLSSDEMEAYVQTGRFAKLAQFETALVYLALAHSRLGHEEEARQAVLRLATAERIAPTYASLPLDPDAAAFESLAPQLVPGIDLGANVRLAQGGVTPAPAAPTPSATVAVATTAERVQLVEQMVAQECARIQREADEKVAAARREADERIARERAAAKREADERIAAAERAAAERVAEIQRAADVRVAAAEASARTAIAAARREPDQVVVVPAPAPVPRPAPVPPPTRTAEGIGDGDTRALLRRANEFAAAGRFEEAREIYARLGSANVSREARVQAAIGLYRIAAYRDAVAAFERLAPFARGEEDLRYYNAVSLFESGRYEEARFELSCALPFIRMTEDVIRYRTRIEQMVAWQNALTPADAVQ